MAMNRRVKIRPPKRTLNSSLDVEKSFSVLTLAISQILNKNASDLSFEQLYRTCYHLVLRKQGPRLYDHVQATISAYLEETRERLISKIKTRQQMTLDPVAADSAILQQIAQDWESLSVCMRMVSDVLTYMDRAYAKEAGKPDSYAAGMALFEELVLQKNSCEVVHLVSTIIVSYINSARLGFIADMAHVRWILDLFSRAHTADGEDLYVSQFETRLMEETCTFYTECASKWLVESNGTWYLKQVEQAIDKEMQLVNGYAPSSSHKVSQLLHLILVNSHIVQVMAFSNEGFDFWISTRARSVLRLLEKLVGDGKMVHNALRDKAAAEAATLADKVRSEAPKSKKKGAREMVTQFAVNWIAALVELKHKYNSICREDFANGDSLQDAVDMGFHSVLNEEKNVGEYLSLFVDSHIKKCTRGGSEQEAETALDNAIELFALLKDKDLFERYYKTHLTKRLLQQKSVSVALERSMIAKLRSQMGPKFTWKLEGMFRDMKTSSDLSSEFELGPGPSFDISLLTATFWPFVPGSEVENIVYPQALSDCMSKFENYYHTKHKGRRLTWAPMLGHVDVRAHYKRTYEISMPTYAAIIMQLFDEKECWTCREIQDRTQIPEQDLLRQLQSIAVAPKTRLLKKTPMSRNISEDDKFTINEAFEAPTTKFKVLTVALRSKAETAEEHSKTMDEVKNNRKFEIDAAIVRIMKSRKRLGHNELIAEIIKQVSKRFTPPPSFIKLRIGSLIEREYLARDSEDRSVYVYLA